ncbi:MAG: DUF6428 family protein [Bacteroidota bacterium]
MKLSTLKALLPKQDSLTISLPDGQAVPPHFHLTEMGLTTKHFVDCGGNIRQEQKVNLQLFLAEDYQHRLAPSSLLKIIEKTEHVLDLGDLEIEVEYQQGTISKFGLAYQDGQFQLTNQSTACLANEACGLPTPKVKELVVEASTGCTPGGGCC